MDKQIEDKRACAHRVARCLPLRFGEADKHLAALATDSVGEDVWRVGFTAELLVERACARTPHKDERDIPGGQHFFGDLCKRQTRQNASALAGEVLYRDA